MKKKKILLFSDDMRMSSGVGTMSREMILGTAHHFDWVQVGGAIKHPEQGQMFDLSEDINKERGIDNANVKVFPVNGYGNPDLLRQMIAMEQPDAIKILIRAVQVAQSKGVYNLDEASIVHQAVQTFIIRKSDSVNNITANIVNDTNNVASK